MWEACYSTEPNDSWIVHKQSITMFMKERSTMRRNEIFWCLFLVFCTVGMSELHRWPSAWNEMCLMPPVCLEGLFSFPKKDSHELLITKHSCKAISSLEHSSLRTELYFKVKICCGACHTFFFRFLLMAFLCKNTTPTHSSSAVKTQNRKLNCG